MKIPKIIKTYCPKCKKHTKQTVSLAKKKERGSLKRGSIARLEKRGSGKAGYGNKGTFSKKAMSGWKRMGAKSSKKQDLRLKCEECKKSHIKCTGKRVKKASIE